MILQDLSAKTPDELRAIIAALSAQAERKMTLKVSEKGALCVYGLGRFPVTLYASQWRRLIDAMPTIQSFMTANAGKLTEKPTT